MAAPDTIEGHCLCGAVCIVIEGPSAEVEICQCSMCRRWGGAFYSAQTGKQMTVRGEEHAEVYRSSEWAERAFCRTCGSNLWFRFLPTGNRSFSAGLFDGSRRFAVEKEIFTDEAADWCRLAGNHPRQTGAEVIAEARAAGFFQD
ncbi:GFA family protein [Qipengyuania sp. RANM35]|uniref:GFA family protein n=1 Tax=Qipengyuania sp. RANM35 TaxID=3068635 RepID=UPI0034DB3E3C